MDDAIHTMLTLIDTAPTPMDESDDHQPHSASVDAARPAWQQLVSDSAAASPNEDLTDVLLRRHTSSVLEITPRAVFMARQFFDNLEIHHESILNNLTEQVILVDPAGLIFYRTVNRAQEEYPV